MTITRTLNPAPDAGWVLALTHSQVDGGKGAITVGQLWNGDDLNEHKTLARMEPVTTLFYHTSVPQSALLGSHSSHDCIIEFHALDGRKREWSVLWFHSNTYSTSTRELRTKITISILQGCQASEPNVELLKHRWSLLDIWASTYGDGGPSEWEQAFTAFIQSLLKFQCYGCPKNRKKANAKGTERLSLLLFL